MGHSMLNLFYKVRRCFSTTRCTGSDIIQIFLVERYNTRICYIDNEQEEEGINYIESFSSVEEMGVVCTFLVVIFKK